MWFLGEESNIACAEAVFFAVRIYHKCLAKKEMGGLVLAVMPFERSWRAIPNHNRGTPVLARHQYVDTSLRIAVEDPIGRYWIGFEIYRTCVDP